MFSSETIPRDMSSRSSSSFLLSSNPSNPNTFLKDKEFNGSDFFQQNHHQQNQIGLARYRSAPSSFLAARLDSNTDNTSSSGDESEAFFSSLMDAPPPRDLNQKSSDDNPMQYSMKREAGSELGTRPGRKGFANGQTGGYESVVSGGGGTVVGSYAVGMENQVHVNGNGNCNSNLVRQSCSPAGFFNGFGVMGEAGNYRVQNHGEATSSAGGLSNHMNFSSAPSSNLRFMPSIPENVNESISTFSAQNGRSRNGNSDKGREYAAAFPHDSWNESPLNSLKRNRDGDPKMFSNFNGLENQNAETRKKSTGLVSHLSLPKTSAEMAAVENILQFQQETTIPCQIRAKRGFATHPRSIAERMRRTRISENMKKLQDLFPTMDKQTNTAEMLDLAVEYIKDLQKQVQNLTDTKAKCVCSSKPQQKAPTT